MSILKGVLEEENERILKLIDKYEKEIQAFPRGSISYKNIKGHKYAYLVSRNKNKLDFKYLGKDEKKINDMKKGILERKKVEKLLKNAKINLKEVKKAIGRKK